MNVSTRSLDFIDSMETFWSYLKVWARGTCGTYGRSVFEIYCNFTMNFELHSKWLVQIISWRNLVKISRLRQIIILIKEKYGSLFLISKSVVYSRLLWYKMWIIQDKNQKWRILSFIKDKIILIPLRPTKINDFSEIKAILSRI